MAKKILIVDDDEGILEAFKAVLDDQGYDVKTSQDAEYIKHLSKHQFPDLILLDILLSGEDGRTLCKKLKIQQDTQNIPVIMMSAALEMEKSVKEACADGFLKKPFEIEEVLNTIKKFTNTPERIEV